MQIRVSGLQIAFLTFAVVFLSVPASEFLLRSLDLGPEVETLVLRMMPFAVLSLLLLPATPMRRRALQLLSNRIPLHRRTEVVAAALAMIPLWWATAGARALWAFATGGSDRLATITVNGAAELANALSGLGMLRSLVFAALVAPFFEELLFRGFLYRALQRDWGWLPALLATSVIFGAYHPFFLNAFAASIVFVCVLRRTGALRAPILVHAFSNLMAWWPLMGQHILPEPSLPPGELSTWRLHLCCLAISVVALPLYVWMSRDRHDVAATVMLEPDGALSK